MLFAKSSTDDFSFFAITYCYSNYRYTSITRIVKPHDFYLLLQRICFHNSTKSNILLTSSCILHSRKFPNKPLVHTYTSCFIV
nr:MAG TPA: hypothetical protein [Bacteriophage sp.]